MTVMITGGTGKLGRQLIRHFPICYTPTRDELDITDGDAVLQAVRKNRVTNIIHTAAMTSIRDCEEKRDEAFEVNVKGTLNLVNALRKSGTLQKYFVYVSTACVFSGVVGNKIYCYTERDAPRPTNFYGFTKLLGEHVVLHGELDMQTLIIRTNFIERGKWPYPSAFTDRYANYLYTDQVAEELVRFWRAGWGGIRHLYGSKRMSMFGFALLGDPDVKPMTIFDYQGPPLTMNMCLSSEILPAVRFDG
jgi:dTDP-4-dehydrorhamnose reductase